MSIDVSQEVENVKTASEFDVLVEKMKVTHPVKYAERLKSGDLAKQRASLIQDVDEVVDLTKLSKPELVALATEKGLALTGEETKAKLVELLK